MKTSYSLIILLIIISCRNEKQHLKDNNKIPVPYINIEKNEALSNISSGIKYIKIENKDNFIVGTIEKAIILDKIYCVQSNKINVCDLNGKAMFEINSYGKSGPEGYIQISDIQVDTINNIIDIWDRMGRKIIRYDSATGEFLNSQRYNVAAFFFVTDQDRNYYFYSGYTPNPLYMKKGEVYQLIKFDKNGKFINKFLKENYTNKMVLCFNYNIINKYNNIIYLSPPANDKIFTFEKNELKEKYTLDFGKKTFNDEIFKDKKHWGILDLKKTKAAWSPGEFKEYIFGYYYTYRIENDFNRVFVSKSTNKSIVFKNFLNDFDGGFPIYPQFIQDNLFFTCFDSHIMKKYCDEIKLKYNDEEWLEYKNFHKDFCTICEKINDLDNPIIVLITPKEF